ncbi:hypothetical protein QOZ80_3BG0272820 [Eleusine coracana subsp. coracana]|nr:hypothetical protein QOZ80_3BG0272820 [Eleusine coracana subsp. coracana]
MSSSKRWASASGASPLHAAALSPARHSAGRRSSVPRSDPAPTTSAGRTLWPSSNSNSSSSSSSSAGENNKKGKKTSLSASQHAASSVATLADHLAKDDTPQPSLSRQRSCTGLPRFADDAEARKISGSKQGGRALLGRSMRFLPSTKPAGVTLTPGRVAPSDLRRLVASLDDAASSAGSECSDASTMGSSTPRTVSNSKPRLLPRTSSVRLLGSSTTQWALSPGRRTGASSPINNKPTTTTLATVPESAANNTNNTSKKTTSLISLGWGHLFNRRKHATDDASLAAAATLLMSSPVVSSSSRNSRGGGEAGHQMRMAHCRLLQWRFANAREDAVRKRKIATAEAQLMGAWARAAEMRGKVARKRVQLDKEKINMKLKAVLSPHMTYLETWEQHVETKHASALATTVDCARAAVCRVPLTNGAKVSMSSLSSTLQHVLDLVLTTKTTTRPFGPTAHETTSVVSELVRVAREEQALLQDCLDLLSQFSTLQVQEQSLHCHLVQSSSSLILLV